MKRTIVQIARIRLGDVQPGDVINLRPDAEHGWFPVKIMRQLPSGDLVATGENSGYNVKATPWDLVGIQVLKVVDMAAPASTRPAGATVDVRLPHDHDRVEAARLSATSSS